MLVQMNRSLEEQSSLFSRLDGNSRSSGEEEATKADAAARDSDDDDSSGDEDHGDDGMMYLGNIAAACKMVNAACKKPYRSEEEKREDRRAANRRSAKMSRDRKKMEREQLQEKATKMAQLNLALTKENQELRKQITFLLQNQKQGENNASTPSSNQSLPTDLSQLAGSATAPMPVGLKDSLAGTTGLWDGSNGGGGSAAMGQQQDLLVAQMLQEQQRKRAASLMSQGMGGIAGLQQTQGGLSAALGGMGGMTGAGFQPSVLGGLMPDSMVSQQQLEALLRANAAPGEHQEESSSKRQRTNEDEFL
uniref:BZIP domain-containing protein n=1 Tax=Grammatophora oceanica TaxID=210454 RepID=A0A7S1UW76_9STRA|mmetsp:Transcript_22761/g.33753  ORF Transcript_22761/g.33753 Transcript_22761/m.33753 type:complete len:306 (+) Transcript_22761:78-995(+)